MGISACAVGGIARNGIACPPECNDIPELERDRSEDGAERRERLVLERIIARATPRREFACPDDVETPGRVGTSVWTTLLLGGRTSSGASLGFRGRLVLEAGRDELGCRGNLAASAARMTRFRSSFSRNSCSRLWKSVIVVCEQEPVRAC